MHALQKIVFGKFYPAKTWQFHCLSEQSRRLLVKFH